MDNYLLTEAQRQFSEERTVFSTMLEKLDIRMQTNKHGYVLSHHLLTLTQNES